jgi:hypothetical protein
MIYLSIHHLTLGLVYEWSACYVQGLMSTFYDEKMPEDGPLEHLHMGTSTALRTSLLMLVAASALTSSRVER